MWEDECSSIDLSWDLNGLSSLQVRAEEKPVLVPVLDLRSFELGALIELVVGPGLS